MSEEQRQEEETEVEAHAERLQYDDPLAENDAEDDVEAHVLRGNIRMD
jgi:hypothetical protein